MTPEQYRNSRERLQILQAYIDNGKNAESVLDIAAALKKDVGQEVLEALLNPKSNTDLLRGYYRGAVLFEKKVKSIIQLGQQKQKKLDEIKKAQKE